MPELPEVETMRRGVLDVIGSTITEAERTPCKKKPILVKPSPAAFSKRAVGQMIDAIDRIGKRVVLRLNSGDSMIFEPRMTGLVLIADPPNEEHLRFRLCLSGGPCEQLLYWDRRGLGSVRLLSPAQMEKQLGPDKLGPDALATTPEILRVQLGKSRRAVKVALLDQKAVAGIGNLYASELLHIAEVHPEKRCDLLTKADWARIHAALIEVLEDAILHEGSTLSDGTYRNALNDPGGYQNLHRVYDRESQPCPNCSGPIKRIVQAQRATFFCPNCQRKQRKKSV